MGPLGPPTEVALLLSLDPIGGHPPDTIDLVLDLQVERQSHQGQVLAVAVQGSRRRWPRQRRTTGGALAAWTMAGCRGFRRSRCRRLRAEP